MSITRIIATAIATAALGINVVGPAAAENWSGGLAGSHRSTATSYPDAVDRAVANHRHHILAPDDRLRIRSPQVSYPDAVARAVANHKADLLRSAHAVSAPQPAEGFDWTAAGVGASTTAALLFIVGIGIGLVRRSSTRSVAA